MLLGGKGVIGKILSKGLANEFELTISDKKEKEALTSGKQLRIDVTNFSELMGRIPNDIDTIVNLTGLPEIKDIANEDEIKLVSSLYIVGTYNVFLAAAQKNIPKVIFASTSHVTGEYETDGLSNLGREIAPDDYPKADSIYGAMKLCGEQFGAVFSRNFGLSVICLRIGTVRQKEVNFLIKNRRARHTLLSKSDTINIFKASIESKIKFGIYFAVSDNPDRPWSIKESISEIGYDPQVNTELLLKEQ